MKRLFTLMLVIVGFVLAACSLLGGSSKESIVVQGNVDKVTGAYVYNGGLMKVFIKASPGVTDLSQIRWKTGVADIAVRDTAMSGANIRGDTVYLHWESLPAPTIKIDTITKAASSSSATKSSSASSTTTKTTSTYDTTFHYLDTIGVVINGIASTVEVVEIKNILPKIDSVWVDSIAQHGDSTITLAVHPGERTTISFRFSDAFNTTYPVQDIQWPTNIGTLVTGMQNDSLWSWTWTAPNTLIDSTMPLVLTDKGGYGNRTYKLHLIVYNESGSAWVVSGTQVVKFSPQGSEVARIKGPFNELSDVVLNSNTTIQNKVWAVDIGANRLYEYDTYGRLLKSDSANIKTPYSVALDVDSRMIWVSTFAKVSGDTTYSKLQAYSIDNSDTGSSSAWTSYTISGPVEGLSVDQFAQSLVWFVSPQQNSVGYIHNGFAKPRIFKDSTWAFNRPSIVSFDPVSGYAWIADSSRVTVMDSSGVVHARITGFAFANSLSAGGGVCWVTDILAGKVYKYPMSISGNHTAGDGLVVGDFISPAFVSTYSADGGAWVSDRGAGQVVRLDVNGKIIASGTGLTLPTIIRVQQVIE